MTLYPAPSTTTVAATPTLKLSYFQNLAYLNSDSDTINGPTYLESYLTYHAQAQVAKSYDPGKYALAKQEADQAWRELIHADIRDTASDFSL